MAKESIVPLKRMKGLGLNPRISAEEIHKECWYEMACWKCGSVMGRYGIQSEDSSWMKVVIPTYCNDCCLT